MLSLSDKTPNSWRGLKTMLGRWGTIEKKDKEPIPGQRYRIAGQNAVGQPSPVIWELEKVIHGSDGRKYARLIRANDRVENKLVSLSTLFDRTFYTPV